MTRAFPVSLILSSDKTTVSITTGHTSYWPPYLSIGNIHNDVCCVHWNGAVLLGFLAILKCKWYISLSVCTYSWKLHSHESLDNINYQRFCCQLLHTSLQKILKPVRHTWLLWRLFIAQMVTTILPFSCLVHTLWISQSNVFLHALFKDGVHSMYISISPY